jgi:hypothetical protein
MGKFVELLLEVGRGIGTLLRTGLAVEEAALFVQVAGVLAVAVVSPDGLHFGEVEVLLRPVGDGVG